MYNFAENILKYRTTKKSLLQVILDFFTLLMCLKDIEDKGIEKEKSEEMEKTVDCPLCLEPLELDDKNFFPCACGYQVCRFCWHRIRTNENGLCPACRRLYPENPANFQPLTPEEIQKVKQQKKMKDIQKKQKIAENRKQLANIRVIQKNLVFAVGLPLELSQDLEKKEKVLQMFRQFGMTLKETITDKTSYAGTQGPGSCIYITYQKSEDAVRAVKSLANTKIDGRVIKVSLGTTKYCSHFLKNAQCPKAECLYLHELADEEASFTKEDIHLGKHYEYEQKLLEQTLHNALQNKLITQNVESNRTNHRNADNSSESSEDQNTYSMQQNNSLCGSESSELSPTNSSQNLENIRNLTCDLLQNETEKNHQNTYSVNPELRNNIEVSPKPVFRSEESIIVNNHCTNPNFQNTSLNPNFNHQILQQKETEPVPSQTNFMNNQIYESASQCRGQSPNCKESLFLHRIISSSSASSSASSSLLVNDSGKKNSVSDVSMMNQEHGNTRSNKRDDEPELGFDPCQESLNALQALMISEAKEKAKLQCNAVNRSPITNHRSPTSYEPFDSYNRITTCQPLPVKIRDPPPGFSTNCTQNIHYKPAFENATLNRAIALHNHLGGRSNYNVQRYTQPTISSNNSFLPDYTSTLSREIPDIIPPVLQQQQQQQHQHQQQQQQQQQQQHNQQRLLNMSQIQFPVTEQRPSPQWNNTSQSQWRPMENSFFNQSVIENRVTNDFNLRMPARSAELAFRQWQQLPGNVNNVSSFQDHTQISEQNAKLQAMYKSLEAARNSPSFGHRLQYTKKL